MKFEGIKIFRVVLFLLASQIDLSVEARTTQNLLLKENEVVIFKQDKSPKMITQKFLYGEFAYNGEVWIQKKNEEIHFVTWSGDLLIYPKDGRALELSSCMQTWIGRLSRENYSLGGTMEPVDAVAWVGDAVKTKVITLEQARGYFKIVSQNRSEATRNIASTYQTASDLIYSIIEARRALARQRSKEIEEKRKALKLWYWQTVFEH